MKKGLVFLLTGLLCIGGVLPASAAERPLETQVTRAFRGANAVGGAVVIMKDGEIVYEQYYGIKNKNSRKAVDENTYFRVASVTKMISGIGAMQLVEQGQLDLDAPIGKAIGYEVYNPYYSDIPVTLRMLMTHTSSIRENGGYTHLSRKLSQLFGSESVLKENFIRRAPGSKYDYSNFGAGVVGAMMESVTGQSVNAYMRENVFAPLGIDAGYSATVLETPEDIASTYYEDGELYRSASAYLRERYDDSANPDKNYRTTVGSLWIRPRDLAKLTQMLCDGGTVDGVQLLAPETVEMMLSSQEGIGGITVEGDYGLFVRRLDGNLVKGKMVYGHQGTYAGYVCNAYFVPEERFVFVMVSNGISKTRSGGIVKTARTLFDLFYTRQEELTALPLQEHATADEAAK